MDGNKKKRKNKKKFRAPGAFKLIVQRIRPDDVGELLRQSQIQRQGHLIEVFRTKKDEFEERSRSVHQETVNTLKTEHNNLFAKKLHQSEIFLSFLTKQNQNNAKIFQEIEREQERQIRESFSSLNAFESNNEKSTPPSSSSSLSSSVHPPNPQSITSFPNSSNFSLPKEIPKETKAEQFISPTPLNIPLNIPLNTPLNIPLNIPLNTPLNIPLSNSNSSSTPGNILPVNNNFDNSKVTISKNATEEEKTLKTLKSVLKEYEERQEKLKEVESSVEKLMNEKSIFPTVKRVFFPKVNLKVQQISRDKAQIIRVANDLCDILSEASRQGQNIFNYTLHLLCSKFIEQAATQVSLHKESAFAIAHVIINICVRFPQMADILIAQFNQSCPYTIPIYFQKKSSQTEADYRELIGYKKISSADSIELESKDSYLERMSGIIALFAAILQTNDQMDSQSSLSLSAAWIWLARFLNLKPIEITTNLLLVFLEIAGYKLQKYGKQFRKIMDYIKNDYFQLLPNNSETKPSLTRLQQFVKDYFLQGKLSIPKGFEISQ